MFDRPIYGIELIGFLCEHGYYAPPTPSLGLTYLFPRDDEIMMDECITIAANSIIGDRCLAYYLNKAGYTFDYFEKWLNA